MIFHSFLKTFLCFLFLFRSGHLPTLSQKLVAPIWWFWWFEKFLKSHKMIQKRIAGHSCRERDAQKQHLIIRDVQWPHLLSRSVEDRKLLSCLTILHETFHGGPDRLLDDIIYSWSEGVSAVPKTPLAASAKKIRKKKRV